MEEQGPHQPQEPIAMSFQDPPAADPTTALSEKMDAAALREGYKELENAAVDAEWVGDFEEAMQQYKDILESKIKNYGEHSGEAADTLSDIGTLYATEEKYEEALRYLNKAMKIREYILLKGEKDHVSMLQAGFVREELGKVYEEMGRHKEAKAVRRRCRAVGYIVCAEINVSALCA